MSVSIAKLTPGEHFENLSSLTELLKKTTKKGDQELIQVLGGEGGGGGGGGDDEEEEEETFRWEIDQSLPEEEPDDLLRRSKYGFNDRHQARGAGRFR